MVTAIPIDQRLTQPSSEKLHLQLMVRNTEINNLTMYGVRDIGALGPKWDVFVKGSDLWGRGRKVLRARGDG